MNNITVIGSINLDTTIRMHKLPKPGETVQSIELFSSGGGKGANQAIAACRNGAVTQFIGAVGNDEQGKVMLDLLAQDKIDVSGIAFLENTKTGRAFVMVDDSGENSIIIHPGANHSIQLEQVEKIRRTIEDSDFLIAQLETNIDSTIQAFEIAKEAGVKTILNPAPAREGIPQRLLACTDIIIPNETEAEILTGIQVASEEDLQAAVSHLHELGIEAVIVTLGSRGSFYDVKGQRGLVPAKKVKAVDTTAAGDTFIGSFASMLKKDLSNIEAAITYATRASSITVQRFGAQPAIPYAYEVCEDKD